MIDIDKVRLWSVRFCPFPEFGSLPFPGMIVEELEGPDYRMPQCCPANIPPEVGGQITVTLAGRGVFHVGEKEYECVPGTAFLYRDCDPKISYHTAEKSQWRFLWINFCGAAAERMIAEINQNYGYFFSVGENDLLAEKLLQYRRYAGSVLRLPPWEGAKIIADFLGILCGNDGNLRVPPGSRLVNMVKDEVQKSFKEPLSGERLARKIGVSREHLSKTFHQETGMQLRDYLAEQRLNEALSLLLKSNLSCKEIASACHYGSYSAFYRAFCRCYGISPDEFRSGKKQSAVNDK